MTAFASHKGNRRPSLLGLRAATFASLLQFRSQSLNGPALVVGVVQPATFLVVLDLAARRSGNVDVSRAALGVLVMSLWGAAVWQSGIILRGERWHGTLASIVVRPAGLGAVLIGKSVGAIVRAIVLIGPTVFLVGAALGHPVPVHHPLLFAASLIAVIASAVTLGLLLSCIFVLTRAAPRIAEVLLYPVFIFGGMLVPLSLLPHWTRPVSAVISLRWGSDLLKAAAVGGASSARDWLALAGTTLVYAVCARYFFDLVLDRARRNATLDLY